MISVLALQNCGTMVKFLSFSFRGDRDAVQGGEYRNIACCLAMSIVVVGFRSVFSCLCCGQLLWFLFVAERWLVVRILFWEVCEIVDSS